MTHTEDWFIVNETHAPDLVCQRRLAQVDGNGDEVRTYWQEVVGPVMIITEHRYRLDSSGLVIGLLDTRTRLVVRSVADVSGNGSEYGITPSVVEDDEQYKQFVFTARDDRASGVTELVRPGSMYDTAARGEHRPQHDGPERTGREARLAHDTLADLRRACAQVFKILDEITTLRDETVQIRDAAVRATGVERRDR